MKRIGIITINGFNNFGNRLQNYALHRYLTKLSDDISVETIWYNNNNYIFDRFILGIKNIRRYIFNRNGFRKSVNNNTAIYDYIKKFNFKKFTDTYMPTRYDFKISKNLNEEYDYFIAGSDQIWYPNRLSRQAEFLTFADQDKRIAYAASFGVYDIGDKKKSYAEMLKKMKYISVREKAGAKIVYDLIGKEVPVLIDPTLLLEKKEWLGIARKPLGLTGNDKYLLTYFLGGVEKAKRDSIVDYAKKNNLKIIDLMDKESIFYSIGPDEFLYLFANSKMVFTDSFHGTVFSIIMGIPFYVFSRNNVKKNMNSRMDTLLELFDLKDRMIKNFSLDNSYNDDIKAKKIHIERILSVERKKAEDYLVKALQIKDEDNYDR